MRTMRRLSASVLIPALVVLGGCGGGTAPSVSSSSEAATVHGTVTFKGHTPAKARITFDPSNINRKVGSNTVDVEPNGTYTIKTLAGENNVTVSSPEINKDPTLSTNSKIVILNPGDNNIPIEL